MAENMAFTLNGEAVAGRAGHPQPPATRVRNPTSPPPRTAEDTR